MADDETKRLLRDLLEAQKEHLSLVRQMSDAYAKQCEAYDKTDKRWHEHMNTTTTATRVATVLRAVALVVMAVVVAYLVFFGLHRH
jgi:rubrerythrin